MSGYSWTCPHCQRPVTITNVIGGQTTLYHDNADGRHTLVTTFTVCPNEDCRKFTLNAKLHRSERNASLAGRYRAEAPGEDSEELKELVSAWQLVPPSSAQTFPDYIPKAIREDYTEACLIKDGSPKAAATLARRCLQGVIRDFWKAKPGRLVDEIEEIKGKVDQQTWDAIDAVRRVGNIGAHMEKDINVIVDVEPQEAELLIKLIESLLKEWYVNREERKNRLNSVINMASEKNEAKKSS